MKRKAWLGTALAAVIGGSVSGAAASPEYRKDPAVRAAVDEKLKTSDEAEIRRRWGPLVDMLDRPWASPAGRARAVVYMRWLVPGAVVEFTGGVCAPKCELRKAFLVHNPEESATWSLTNFMKEPAFDVLWEDGRGDRLGVNHGTFVQLNGLIYRFDAAKNQVQMDGTRLSPLTSAEFTALTGVGEVVQPPAPVAIEKPKERIEGLKPTPEAVLVCTRPDAKGNFRCDSPQRAGLSGGPGGKGRPETPEALLEAASAACPSKRRLPSRTHLVWGCGFAATKAAGAADRGEGVEMRGRGTYQCLEREAACKRTESL